MVNVDTMKKDKGKVNNKIVIFLSSILVVYIITTKLLRMPDPFVDRSIYLLLSFLMICCFQFPKYQGASKIILILGTLFAASGCVYMSIFSDKIIGNWFMATDADFYSFVFYFIGIVILLQGSIGGKIISGMGVIAVIYLFLGRYMPGIFTLPDLSIRQVATMVYTDIDQGAFGVFLSVMSRILSVFLMFSALLLATGLGDLIRSVSMLVAGKSRGAPAKVAVIASGLFGMLSGSPVANVAATGSFTIPLMKSLGYKPKTAGAIETVASTGGSLAPPIMGLSAFIMCEIIGVPYTKVIVWAIIPAFLWYFSAYCFVHFSALAQNVDFWEPPRQELIEALKGKVHLVIAVFILVFFIVYLKVAELAALYSIIALFFLSFLRKGTRLNWEKTQGFLINFAKLFSGLCVLNSMLGIFTAAFLSTGMHTKLILLIFGGITNWFVICLITFGLCLIFGMLLPPFAAYITVVLVAVPVLHQLGFAIPVIHMFVLYGCALAPITPPVALAAYTAAAIAGADAVETAKEASFKALPLWIIPFILFKQSVFIGMNTSLIKVLAWTAVMMVGIIIFTMASNRYCFGKLSLQWVIWLLIVTAAIMQPMNLWFSIFSCSLGAGSVIILFYLNKAKHNLDVAI